MAKEVTRITAYDSHSPHARPTNANKHLAENMYTKFNSKNNKTSPKIKRDFQISLKEAERICEALELAASWDKTEIYYKLKEWVDEHK